tara:strand:- start:1609 stop:1857 length:249 start_codon:yes stop_codon:yes gene_type:complete
MYIPTEPTLSFFHLDAYRRPTNQHFPNGPHIYDAPAPSHDESADACASAEFTNLHPLKTANSAHLHPTTKLLDESDAQVTVL